MPFSMVSACSSIACASRSQSSKCSRATGLSGSIAISSRVESFYGLIRQSLCREGPGGQTQQKPVQGRAPGVAARKGGSGASMPASALEIIERHAAQAGGLLPALHELQETFGYLPAALVDSIAQAFNISRAEVHGVISFYPDFRTDPAGTHVLRICRAEACQSMGG